MSDTETKQKKSKPKAMLIPWPARFLPDGWRRYAGEKGAVSVNGKSIKPGTLMPTYGVDEPSPQWTPVSGPETPQEALASLRRFGRGRAVVVANAARLRAASALLEREERVPEGKRDDTLIEKLKAEIEAVRADVEALEIKG